MRQAIYSFLAAAAGIALAAHAAHASQNDGGVSSFYGAFSTSVPIDVPAFHGIEPHVALQYSSSGGNSFVGAGWSLTGISSIERASPGGGAPTYTSSDIYLLDGQELIPCATGSASPSCLAGGTHSTKIESYAKISFSSSANTWSVWAPNGVKMTLSSVYTAPIYSTCSQPTHSSDTVQVTCTHWVQSCDKYGCNSVRQHSYDNKSVACTHLTYYDCNPTYPTFRYGVTKVEDTSTNAVNYTWACTGGDCYPDKATYTGGEVRFYRESRTDTWQHQNGSKWSAGKTLYRLKTVEVRAAGVPVRAYKLGYAYSDSTLRSQLTSVTQYGKGIVVSSSGAISGGSAMPAITYGYETLDGALSYTTSNTTCQTCSSPCNHVTGTSCDKYGCTSVYQHQTCDKYGCTRQNHSYSCNCTTSTVPPLANRTHTGGHGVGSSGSTFADIDGDGKQEYVTRSGSTHYITRYTATGVTNQTFTGCHGNGSSGWTYADLDGDGKQEYVTRSGSTHYITRYTATGCLNYTLTGGHSVGSNGWTYADLDGNGKEEYVTRTSGTHYITRYNTNTSGAFVSLSNQTYSSCHGNGSTGTTYSDIDGDGKDEYIARSGATHNVSHFGSTSCTNETLSGGHGAGSTTWAYPDIDGDGKAEYVTTSGGTHYVTRYTSKGVVNQTFTGCAGNLGSGAYFLDIDGDGRTEYITHNSSGSHQVSRYTATGCVNTTWSAGHGVGSSGWTYSDIDGDGAAEYVTRSSGTHYITDFGRRPDLLTSIKGVWGATTQVAYAPMSTWANTNNPPAGFTVNQVTSNDGRGGITTRSYEYSGGLHDRVARRFLGFGYARETEPCVDGHSTCPYNETWFHQDYGSQSMPERIDHRNRSGILISSSLFTYQTNGATVPYTAKETERWEYIYDGSGQTCSTYPCSYGKRTRISRTYDSYGNTAVETAWGDYDVSGDEITTSTTYYPSTSKYIMNLPGRVLVYANSAASGTKLNETRLYYDQTSSYTTVPTKGLLLRDAKWVSTSGAYINTYKTYDAWANVLTSTNETGAVASSTYDSTYHLFPLSKTDALGKVTTATYDYVCGKPLTATQSDGRQTTVTYDSFCRETQVNSPGGAFTKYSYVSMGTPTAQYTETRTPGPGSTELYKREYYDGFGRVWRTQSSGPTSSQAIRVDTDYDARGNAKRTSLPYYANASVKWVNVERDSQDRTTKITNPDNTYSTAVYGLGYVTHTDELGRWRTEYRNTLGHVTELREKLGTGYVRTRFSYDRAGKPTQIIDDAGNTWTFAWDSLGRRVSVVDPNTGTWTYGYDAASRETSRTEGNGKVTTQSFDAAGRILSRTYGSGSASPITTTWAYDQVRTGYYNQGKPTTITDASGTQTLDYDIFGNPVKTTRVIDGTSYTFTKGFDIGGRLLWNTYADGDTAGTAAAPLTYDAAGRMVTLPGYVNATSYDAAGNILSQTYANGTITTRTYDANRLWLKTVNTVKGTTSLQNLTLTRNAGGKITAVASAKANEGWNYAYDDLGRLTSSTNTSSSSHNQTLAYNKIGNITSNSRVGSYAYPSTGTARPHAVSSAGSNTYAYDAAGQMTSGAGRTITWNAAGRPATVNGATFTYAGSGERIKKTENGATTIYLGPDYEVKAGVVTKYLAFGGVQIAKKVGSTKYWLHTDHLGSVQAVTDSAGVEKQRLIYRPYGERLSTSTSHVQTRSYTGQVQDDSGLFYMNARYYDPVLGRFLSADPTMPAQSSVGLNRYSYAANDPINQTDTDGLGLFSKIKKAVKSIGKSLMKLAAKVAKIPLIGGLLSIVLNTVGAIFVGDIKMALRGIATLAVIALTYYASGWAGGEIAKAITNQVGAFAARALAQAAIGAVSGYSIARINGASHAQALGAGIKGAKVSFAMEVFSSALDLIEPIREAKTGMKYDLGYDKAGGAAPRTTLMGWIGAEVFGDVHMFYEGGSFGTMMAHGASRGQAKLMSWLHDSAMEIVFKDFYTTVDGQKFFNPSAGTDMMRMFVEGPGNFGSILAIAKGFELAGEKIESRAVASGHSSLGYFMNVSLNSGVAVNDAVAYGIRSKIMRNMGLD